MSRLSDFLPEKTLPVKDFVNGFIPRVLTVPFRQEARTICVPAVSVGDRVAEGQIIAQPQGLAENGYGAAIHAPVPGIVTEISECSLPGGKQSMSAKIKLNGNFSYLGKNPIKVDWTSYTSSSFSRIISRQGIINTFVISEPESLAEQIENLKKRTPGQKRRVIVRLFDEDPSRLTDSFITSKRFSDIRTGACIAAKAAEASSIVFVYDKSDRNIIDFSTESDIDGLQLLYFGLSDISYPVGFKRQLICESEKSRNSKQPFLIGHDDLFTDASTMIDLFEAVVYSKPAITRYVHISGDSLGVNGLLHVRIGTTLDEIVKQIGGFRAEPSKIIVNGLVTGCAVSSLDVPITKCVKSVAFVSRRKVRNSRQYECVRCGKCRRICPANLYPDLLYFQATGKVPRNAAIEESAYLCTKCGLCNSVCISRLPLCQYIEMIGVSKNE